MILLTNLSYATEPVSSQSICFSNSDGGKIVVILENFSKQQEVINLLKEENVELSKKIENLEGIIIIQQDQLKMAEKATQDLKTLLNTQQQLYEKQIKESKFSLWNKLGLVVSGIGIGTLIVAIF